MPVIPSTHETAKCPHCMVHFSESWKSMEVGTDANLGCFWLFRYVKCPACTQSIFVLRMMIPTGESAEVNTVDIMAWPKVAARIVPDQVAMHLAQDFREACLVLKDSPKASAALSRRCLQALLREAAKVKPGNLIKEIQQVLDSNTLPSYLADQLDALRHIGNFAAHTTKDTNSGEIIDVEPGEAEWQLDTLEGLFDFYFVQPAALNARKEALNKKLKSARKPELK